MTRPWLSVATAVLVAVMASAACDRGGSDTRPAVQREARTPKVVVQFPQRLDYTHDMVLPGTLEPFEEAQIYGQVAGYLDAVEVEIGDEVKAGDVLARIFAPEVGAEVRRAQANLLASRTQVKQFEEAKQLAELERERRQKLREAERGAIAQKDIDVAESSAEMASAKLATAEASIQGATAELNRIRARKGFSVVRAPFGARVTRRHLHPGALVRETSSSAAEPIVELQRINPMRLSIDIPEQLVAHIKVGHEIEISYDALPERHDKGTVARVSGSLDPMTRSMRVEADILNDDRSLLPGLFAHVRLTAVTLEGALQLPSPAIRGNGDDRSVLVVVGGTLERRPVTVLVDDGKKAVIASGLSESDQVVVAGSPLAVEGSPVEVAEVREP